MVSHIVVQCRPSTVGVTETRRRPHRRNCLFLFCACDAKLSQRRKRNKMGNTNSSPRYRSRSPDPSSLEQTWNNSYPKVERERNRSARQQHAQQNQSKHLTGYPSAVSGGNVMVNGHLNANAHYDQFEQECIQQQQQQQQPKMPDQQPLRFARCVHFINFI